MSFEINLDPKRKVFSRFLSNIHDQLYSAFEKRRVAENMTKTELAEKIGVHKSLITRKFNGTSNLTAESMAYLAWALDHYPELKLTPLEDLNNNQPTYLEVYSGTSQLEQANIELNVYRGMESNASFEFEVRST